MIIKWTRSRAGAAGKKDPWEGKKDPWGGKKEARGEEDGGAEKEATDTDKRGLGNKKLTPS